MAVENDDGTPGASQATQDMAIVNEPPELESDPAAATMDGPAAAAQTLDPEPDTIVPGSAARASTSSKNVSFNLLQQQQQPGYTAHDADSDDDDDDGICGGDGDVTSSVRVAVRIRPFLPSETGTSGVIDVLPSAESAGVATTTSTGGRNKRKRRQEAIPTSLQIGGPAGAQFTYDAVHGTKSTQADLYLDTVRPLVRQCLKGCELQMGFVMFMAMYMLLPRVSNYIHFFCITNNAIIFLTVMRRGDA